MDSLSSEVWPLNCKFQKSNSVNLLKVDRPSPQSQMNKTSSPAYWLAKRSVTFRSTSICILYKHVYMDSKMPLRRLLSWRGVEGRTCSIIWMVGVLALWQSASSASIIVETPSSQSPLSSWCRGLSSLLEGSKDASPWGSLQPSICFSWRETFSR